MTRYLLAWTPMILLAVGNGWFRERFLLPRVGDLRGHQLSTVLLSVLVAAYVWALDRVWPFRDGAQALGVGALWVALTIAFELVFGHWVGGTSWSRLLEDWNLARGRVGPLFLAWLGLAPWLVERLRS